MPAKTPPVAKLPDEKVVRSMKVIQDAVRRFSGDIDDLESAIGMYMLGHYMGWKVLVLVHSKRTIRKYEKILNIVVRDEFEDQESQTSRSLAWSAAQTVSNFWKAVSGEDKVIEKGERKMLT
jgi:hypothetical protein